ncbi:chemotaxis response regulator protein-glutamate methylesterase [Aliarcobacter butzleri]|uniref:protein-glutamate methylesterase/protein-glutamine glutaminase n=1 Tax=Aliarcobacter butzleri TaxID=28197 RepID=UPI0001F1353E|nr:chemotaxis response regulator protein-glutamate methylesterase [Aliarcobacter butzleri]EFU69236.1 chemotaxis response regulator protein-glutamate methylesterase [Aliarcobacter butzleri JV22]KLE05134.1 chemotaxis protein [Aliarcobacter butzleri L353]MCG3712223.1 chemotaxis response regulator protein-glutamate methylesterase [Aliarcobacter butzleri]MCT7564901.1 chemotaxis response regulator protein-glutamate methylesterase [Aliarcobacter butzleri]
MYTVLVIDDSASMRSILKDMINSIEDFEVIAVATDAYDAREKIKEYEPDLVTIDINMPKMDGVTFLRNLMRLHPMPAVVISGESVRGNDIFDDGAVGFIPKPNSGEPMSNFEARIKDTLLNLTFLLSRYTLKKSPAIKKPTTYKSTHNVDYKVHPDEVIPLRAAKFPGAKVIAIGSSTGGVESLLRVFKKLPSGLPPIVITQHIPYGFSNSLAHRLNDNSEVEVCEAKDGLTLEKGHAYLAPGNMHLTIEKYGNDFKTRLLDTKKVSQHKPSVDVLFRSVNNAVGGGAMAVMMTGMGDDGTIAMKELFDNGAYTIAQNEASCVVFGMPMKAIQAGAVKDIVHLDEIADYIIDFSKGKLK